VSGGSPLRWYLGALVGWFVGSGAQATLFPWLVAVLLSESAVRVGAAQTLAMLPALLLVLPGGVVADRSDGRSLLIRLHALAAVPPAALAIALAQGHRSYAAVLAYAIAMGAISALAIPTRDALLSRVGGPDLQRAVTLSIALQVASQIAGTLVGGLAATWGAPSVLAVQAGANLAGALASRRLPPASPSPSASSRTGRWAEIREGFRELVRTPRLLPVTLLFASVGLLFLGAFLVAMPLVVRDAYAGSSVEIAAANGSMMAGMFAGSGALLVRGGARHEGRALILSLVGGALALAGISLGPPLPVVYGLVFAFGVGGGIAMPVGRTLIQEAAPETHRGRVLSVYNLAFLGSAPLGAFGMGLLVEGVGALSAMLAPGVGMLLVVAAALSASEVWRFESRSGDARG
jgi:MFS family permease